MFKTLIASLGLAPKSLDAAKATQDAAKAFADQVSALFASAEIDLEALLASGPDSLNSFIEARVLEGCTEAAAEVATFKAAADASAAAATALQGKLDESIAAGAVVTTALAAAGVKPDESKPFAEAFPVAFEKRISTKARELLAATGGPLLDDVVAKDVTSVKPKAGELTRAEFNALPVVERTNFAKSGGKLTE